MEYLNKKGKSWNAYSLDFYHILSLAFLIQQSVRRGVSTGSEAVCSL